MGLLAHQLTEAVRHRSMTVDDLDPFFALDEYRRFVDGAEALGFVCHDFSVAGMDTSSMVRNPEQLTGLPLQQLRRYVHVLIRSERSNVPDYSVVFEAVVAGALKVLADRLMGRPA